MNYKMVVEITDPNTPEGMYSGLVFELDCHFEYDKDQYGNGHYVSIKGKDFNREVIDIRYDHSFNPESKELWLHEWARGYWTGKDGAWSIRSLKIERV